MSLPTGWCKVVVPVGVDPQLPGIYQWSVEGVGVYVGKYKYPSRPLVEYERNLMKIMEGRPYKALKPEGFRPIHLALYEAIQSGKLITLTIIENGPVAALTVRRDELIRERGTLNGQQARSRVSSI